MFNCNLNLSATNSIIKQHCLSLLNSCTSLTELFQIHAQIITCGLHFDTRVIDEIIRFCTLHPLGSLSYARFVINHSSNSLRSSWNNLIRAFVTNKNDSPRESIWVFVSMRRFDVRPDTLTYPFLFKACGMLSAFEEGRQIHGDVVKHGVGSDVYVQNTMIHFYGSCKKIIHARHVFDEMLVRTLVSWNSVVSACVENSCFSESMEYFGKMRDMGFEPDETTMVIMLSACAELGNLSLGKWIHSQVIGKGLVVNCQLGTALVDMYAKCGAVDYSRLVFERTTERNVWTWSAMVLGLAQHGFAIEALDLFSKMKLSSIKPNYVTFLGVLCACSHAGLVKDGYKFFHDMKKKHGIKPSMVHFGAMVDVLGRAGRLKEAHNFILNMPIKPDATIWRTLLSACYIHDINDNEGIGEKVRRRLLELEPKRCGNFVMIANKYAETGMWEQAIDVRSRMRDRGLKKMAGQSCIEVGGSIYKFFSGDVSEVECEYIFLLMDRLNFHMRMFNCDSHEACCL